MQDIFLCLNYTIVYVGHEKGGAHWYKEKNGFYAINIPGHTNEQCKFEVSQENSIMRLDCVVLLRLVSTYEFFFTLSKTQKEKSKLAMFSGLRCKHVKYVGVN